MKRNRAGLLAAVVLPCIAWALRVEVPPMAMPEFADTEVSTNIPVNVCRSDVRGLDVSMELCATPSNNVQAAFGRDTDGDRQIFALLGKGGGDIIGALEP